MTLLGRSCPRGPEWSVPLVDAVGGTLVPMRVRARRRQARRQHCGARRLNPGRPSEPCGLSPKGEGVEDIYQAGKGLERGNRREADGNLVGETVGRLAMHDLDIE